MYYCQSAWVPSSPQRRFGSRIRELRLAAGLRQEDLAERCGLFRTYMSRVETGRANPTLTMIHALADSLGVAVTELFVAAPSLAKTAAVLPRPSRGRVSK